MSDELLQYLSGKALPDLNLLVRYCHNRNLDEIDAIIPILMLVLLDSSHHLPVAEKDSARAKKQALKPIFKALKSIFDDYRAKATSPTAPKRTQAIKARLLTAYETFAASISAEANRKNYATGIDH